MKISTLKSVIKHQLSEETSMRIVCPACGGGTTGERCLSIWNGDDGLMATCHRAQCDVGTLHLDSASSIVLKPSSRDTRDHVGRIINETVNYDTEDSEGYITLPRRLCSREVVVRPDRIRYSPKENALVYPMYDRHFEVRGVVRRYLDKSRPYKSDHVKDESWCGMSWYIGSRSQTEETWVFEDALSAMHFNWVTGYDSVSLNGTKLGTDRIDDLQAHGKPLVLALDADATATALRMLLKYSGYVSIRAVRLNKDVKWMGYKEVHGLVDRKDV